MYAYVINLTRSPDRRAHIVGELQRTGLDYEIVPAVDGQTLDLKRSALIDPSLGSRCPFPLGAAGCALSHFKTYQKVLEDGRDHALILEDDVRLPADLSDLVDDVAGHLTGAEVALLNFASYPPGPLGITFARDSRPVVPTNSGLADRPSSTGECGRLRRNSTGL